VASTEYLAICHPERRKPIRFANRFSESKDPYYECIEAGVERRSLHAFDDAEERIPWGAGDAIELQGILRLRLVFRKSAKDKPSLRMANDD
jgi:hypothetical protein